MSARQSRLAKGYEAAKGHFKKVTERVKGTVEAVKKQGARVLPKSNPAKVAKHAMKQRAVDAGQAAKKDAKMVKQKVPTPGPKRTR